MEGQTIPGNPVRILAFLNITRGDNFSVRAGNPKGDGEKDGEKRVGESGREGEREKGGRGAVAIVQPALADATEGRGLQNMMAKLGKFQVTGWPRSTTLHGSPELTQLTWRPVSSPRYSVTYHPEWHMRPCRTV